MTEYRIVYGTIVLYDYTRLSLGLDSISFNVQRTQKLSVQNENNVVLNENSVEEKKCINIEVRALISQFSYTVVMILTRSS